MTGSSESGFPVEGHKSAPVFREGYGRDIALIVTQEVSICTGRGVLRPWVHRKGVSGWSAWPINDKVRI